MVNCGLNIFFETSIPIQNLSIPIILKHDDVKNHNKPAALCIVEFIGGQLSDNTMIIPPF